MDIAFLRRFVNLASITLYSPQSLADFGRLQQLTALRALTIWSADMCDLYPLRAMPGLRELRLRAVGAYANLTWLIGLTRLAFCDTAAATSIASLSGLRSLELCEGNALPALTALTRLSSLRLSNEHGTHAPSPALYQQLLPGLVSLQVLHVLPAVGFYSMPQPVVTDFLMRLCSLSLVELTNQLQSLLPSLTCLQSLGLDWYGWDLYEETESRRVASNSLTCLRLECSCEDGTATMPDMRSLPRLSLLQLDIELGQYLLSASVLPSQLVRVETRERGGELFLKPDTLSRIQYAAVTSLGSLT